MYAWQLSGNRIDHVIDQFREEQDMQIADVGYFEDLVRGVARAHEELDAAILPFLDREIARVDPIERTFDTLPDTDATRGSWLLSVKGANHFAIAFPQDGGLPRRRDDFPATADVVSIRDLIARATLQFLQHHVRNLPGADSALAALLDQSPLAAARTR